MLVLSLALTMMHVLSAAGSPPSSKSTTPAVIAVIIPEATTPSMVDALNRLRGEATSVGFQIRVVQSPAAGTPQVKLERVARDLAPAAVVALSADEQEGTAQQGIRAVDVWFLDRGSGKLSVGHLTVEESAGARAEQALAVSVVDFMRARMFDSLVRSSVESKDERLPPAPPIPLGRYQVSAGLAALGSSSGFATAWLPFVEARFTLRPWLGWSLAGGGFGTQVRERSTAGSVEIEQRLLKTGAAFVAPVLARRWYLHVESGLSLLFFVTRGQGNSGYAGHAAAGVSPGAHCVGGVALVLTPHIVLQSWLGAVWLWREQQVFIADDRVARTGRTAWLGSAMLGVMF